jgi:biopolymer transport protein TolQ
MHANLIFLSFTGAYAYRDLDLIELVTNASPVAQFILLVLLFFSVASWAIIIFKLHWLRRAGREDAKFKAQFWESRKLDLVNETASGMKYSPLAHIFVAGYGELRRIKKETAGEAPPGRRESLDMVGRALTRSTSAEAAKLDRYLNFLATTGSSTPFIGLFGTVWGIMEAFRNIGIVGSATLSTVAPGISEALVATAAGLVAAIPAVIGYNYLLGSVKSFTNDMELFSSDFLSIIDHHFL